MNYLREFMYLSTDITRFLSSFLNGMYAYFKRILNLIKPVIEVDLLPQRGRQNWAAGGEVPSLSVQYFSIENGLIMAERAGNQIRLVEEVKVVMTTAISICVGKQ